MLTGVMGVKFTWWNLNRSSYRRSEAEIISHQIAIIHVNEWTTN